MSLKYFKSHSYYSKVNKANFCCFYTKKKKNLDFAQNI